MITRQNPPATPAVLPFLTDRSSLPAMRSLTLVGVTEPYNPRFEYDHHGTIVWNQETCQLIGNQQTLHMS